MGLPRPTTAVSYQEAPTNSTGRYATTLQAVPQVRHQPSETPLSKAFLVVSGLSDLLSKAGWALQFSVIPESHFLLLWLP